VTTTIITITDPELLAKLAAAEGHIVFRGPGGEHVKTAETVPFGKPPAGFKLAISDEELERRRQEKTGRSLDEILRDLEQKPGER
jgi:hypothetical protein